MRWIGNGSLSVVDLTCRSVSDRFDIFIRIEGESIAKHEKRTSFCSSHILFSHVPFIPNLAGKKSNEYFIYFYLIKEDFYYGNTSCYLWSSCHFDCHCSLYIDFISKQCINLKKWLAIFFWSRVFVYGH